MKSTQDLAMFLRAVQNKLDVELALVITADKGVDIVTIEEGIESKIVFSEANVDINDLPYLDPKEIAKQIKDTITLDIDNLKVEDL